MARSTGEAGEARAALHESLGRVAQKLQESSSVMRGTIVLRLAGSAGGNYSLECGENEVRVTESAAAGIDQEPLIEVVGDADIVRAIIDGEKDARKQFLSGGIRLRGDLRYFSDLAVELGILKTPL